MGRSFLVNYSTTLVSSGGAPFNGEVVSTQINAGEVSMSDSFGDGWNGNILDVNGQQFTLLQDLIVKNY